MLPVLRLRKGQALSSGACLCCHQTRQTHGGETKMKTTTEKTTEEIFGPVIFRYTRKQAIEDGVLVDVSETAQEAGIKLPTALTQAVFEQYVAVSPEMKGEQDESGRLWDILWMFSCAVRGGQIDGEQGSFELIVAKPDRNDWQGNEKPFEGDRKRRLVTLKAVCGPNDEGSACITIMRPEED